ncbi:hypothetical protein DFJ77DRAFT_537944 [Powellomyces hirtus]|nr:hypothetical protein DFJ77DRAFT_537944 [Powellomyces hirtus]
MNPLRSYSSLLIVILLIISAAVVNGQLPPLRPRACSATRRRVEFRELSVRDRYAYLTAVKCLRQTPSRLGFEGSRSVYDDFVAVHRESVPVAHGVASFLPWHRPFLAFFEVALNQFCGYTGTLPYWDWSYDSQAPERSILFSNAYFGSNGNIANNTCVNDGVFADTTAAYPELHCLARDFDIGDNDGMGSLMGAQYSPIEMEWIVRQPTYDAFRQTLESHPHNNVHMSIGGDMQGLITSVNDPIFWLHHCNLDRWWARWQLAHPLIRDTYSGNIIRGADDDLAADTDILSYTGMWTDTMVWEVMNFTGGMDGLLCYTYSNSIGPANITEPGLLEPVLDPDFPLPGGADTPGDAGNGDDGGGGGGAFRRRRHRRKRRQVRRQAAQLHKLTTPSPFDRSDATSLRSHRRLPAEYFVKNNMTATQTARVQNAESHFDKFLDAVNSAHWKSLAALDRWTPDPVPFVQWDLWKKQADVFLDSLNLDVATLFD